MIRSVHRAKFVLPEPGILLQNAAVHVSDPGRVSRVEPWQGGSLGRNVRVIDWGDAALIPGLVNAHTHLELPQMSEMAAGSHHFVDWLSRIVMERSKQTQKQLRTSAYEGATKALQSGTTLLGDISFSGQTREALQSVGIRKVVFEEIFALETGRAAEAVTAVEDRLQRAVPDVLTASGISPQAPYSVSPKLYRDLAAISRQREMPMATHVAESRDEIEFLGSGTGQLRDFLTRIGALPDGWTPPKLCPVPYLEVLGVLDQSPLLIHCNYLDATSIAAIQRSRCSVVFCPRSHAYFGHEEHPVRQLLDAGVNVALGTDSLASNDSLSMLDEIRFLFRARKDLRCSEILQMATLNGAAALGFGGLLGRLRRGHWADMAVLKLPVDVSERNLLAQILDGAGECSATIVAGEIVWQRGENPLKNEA